MTEVKTIDLFEVDAVEYAAAIGHAAAGQLFYVLSGGGKGFRGDWIGCDPSEEEELEQRIYELANYVAERDAGGARLWQKARIDGVIVVDLPESLQFSDAPLPRQWAYDMFATVSLHAFLQISRTQKAARDAAALAATENPPLKLEDSIFEPVGKLDELDPHARQFLQDQAAAGRAAKEAEAAASEAGQSSLSAGGAIGDGASAPPSLSVGMQQGNQNAQDTADDGQDQGDQEIADPDAQGDVSEVADNADEEQEGQSIPPSEASENDEAAELEEPVEDAISENGTSDDGHSTTVKPLKGKSRKSKN